MAKKEMITIEQKMGMTVSEFSTWLLHTIPPFSLVFVLIRVMDELEPIPADF